MLGFSVLGGISASMVFTPSVACIAHWFLRCRALATGVAATAGGAGGIIFPLIVSSLTGTVGFAWAIRIIGFISAGFCGVGTLLLRTRLPRDPMKKGTIDIGALRERQFALLSAAVLLVDFALLIPLTYLPSYAQSHGMKTSLAYQLASILSAASIFGRTFSGYFADRLGRFNMMIICTFVCCVITLVLWLPARSNSAAILAYTVLFGFWSGSAISLPPVCVAQISKTEDFGKRYGTTYFLVSLGTLLAIPIGGGLLRAQVPPGGKENYSALIIFCGVIYFFACLLFVLARCAGPGRKTKVF
jgi:MFS family permease